MIGCGQHHVILLVIKSAVGGSFCDLFESGAIELARSLELTPLLRRLLVG